MFILLYISQIIMWLKIGVYIWSYKKYGDGKLFDKSNLKCHQSLLLNEVLSFSTSTRIGNCYLALCIRYHISNLWGRISQMFWGRKGASPQKLSYFINRLCVLGCSLQGPRGSGLAGEINLRIFTSRVSVRHKTRPLLMLTRFLCVK